MHLFGNAWIMGCEACRALATKVFFATPEQRVHVCAHVLVKGSQRAIHFCIRLPWGWHEAVSISRLAHKGCSGDASSFPHCPSSTTCILFVHACTGLAFPLEEPLGGAQEWFWDQEIFLQGLEASPLPSSCRSSQTFGLTQLRDTRTLFMSPSSRHQKSISGKALISKVKKTLDGISSYWDTGLWIWVLGKASAEDRGVPIIEWSWGF